MTWALVALVCYVAAQLAIGVIVSRRVQSEQDYLVAGRRLGPWLVTFSVFATWFGAETCVGSSAAAFEAGLSASRADPFGYTLALLAMSLWFAVPLWNAGFTTLGDLLRARFGPATERLATLVMIPTSLLWAAAQIRAFGHVVAWHAGWSVEAAILAAALVVVIYSASGGLWADAITDVLQGAILIVGLLVLFGAVWLAHGWQPWSEIELTRWNPLGLGSRSWGGSIESWLVPICGSMVTQELAQRIVAARSPQLARRASLTSALLYVSIGAIPVLLGLIGPQLLPDLTEPERLLPGLAQSYLGPAFAVILSGALISAILSTVDSCLLAVGALVSHNVWPMFRAKTDSAVVLKHARWAVVGAGLLAYLAARSSESVFELVEQASAFGGGGLFLVLVVALRGRHPAPRAGWYALVASVLIQLSGTYLFAWGTPFTWSLLVSFASYTVLSRFERSDEKRGTT
jgi:Na+/proline symporter